MRRLKAAESRSSDPQPTSDWGGLAHSALLQIQRATSGRSTNPLGSSIDREKCEAVSVAIADELADTRSLTGFSRAPEETKKCARASCPNGGKNQVGAACSALFPCWLYHTLRRGNLPLSAITWAFFPSPQKVSG